MSRPRVVWAGLLVLALCVLVARGVFMARHRESMLFYGTEDEYNVSFYNRAGRRISSMDGPLRLMMDPFTIFTNYPNQWCASYSIDEHGFRGGWVLGTQEVAMVLGSSAAFGFGLSANDLMFSSRLNQMNHRYHFTNAAVCGFLSGQELAQMVHYLDDYHPKLYVVFDGWNDAYAPYALSEQPDSTPLPLGYNPNYFMLEDRMARCATLMHETKYAQVLPKAFKPVPRAEILERISQNYLANILKMRDFARARHADFLLVFQPDLASKVTLTAEELPYMRRSDNFLMGMGKQFHERYLQMIKTAVPRLEEEGVHYIDLNRQPEIVNGSQTLFLDACHPSARGHEIIAAIINRAIGLGVAQQ